jgi:8-hydroxy-5-deazaflavin:NADPH oxidoreductase
MNIGIIGAGKMGSALGKLWAKQGHDVMFSFTRDAAALTATAAAAGERGHSGTPAEAAQFGDVTLLAVPWAAVKEAVKDAAPLLAGKILISCNNPLKPDLSGLVLGTSSSGAEEVARLAARAKVVEVLFPFAEQLQSGSLLFGSQRPSQFYCGDDAEAKKVVATLIGELQLEPIDAGPLSSARYLEPLGMLLVQLAYKQGLGSNIATQLLRR